MTDQAFDNRGDAVISSVAIPQTVPVPMAATRPAKIPAPSGKLPTLFIESSFRRWAFGVLTAALIIGYSFALHVYWAPGHPGTDQNGYLVGGKLLADTGSSGFKPADPYMFVGRMWVESEDGWYFPKYPVGLSLIYAITYLVGGSKFGVALTYLVSPIMMSLALAATFLLIRLAVGSFCAVLGVLIFATSAVTLGLTNNPNSHATAVCLVTWGIYFLIRWWQRNGLYRAIAAGFLIGSAVTIRYTEGLLVLPLAIVLLLNLRWKDRRSWIEAGTLAGSWAFPVLLLLAYNWFSFHHFTGYDPTNESTGFSWENFQTNWEVMLRQIYTTGLFFILPFSILGLVMMWRWNWRFAMMLAAWVLPNLALYSAYYWAPDGTSIAYLRFFLTIFPALTLAAVWSLGRVVHLAEIEGSRVLPAVAAGIVLCIGCGFSLYSTLPEIETDAQTNLAVTLAGEAIGRACPAGSVVFAFVPDRMVNHIQFTGNYQLYDGQQFSRQGMQRMANVDPNQPAGLQPQRAKEMYDRLSRMSDADLLTAQNDLMTDAFSKRKRVFVIVNQANTGVATRFLRFFNTDVVGGWTSPPEPRPAPRRARAGLPVLARLLGNNADQIPRAEFQIMEVKSTTARTPPPSSMRRNRPRN